MKRSGIVLMMTLTLIMIMMGIVTLILNQSSSLNQLSQYSFTRPASSRIINDLEKEFPSMLNLVTGAEELDLAMRLPLQIEKENESFKLKVIFASPYSKININHLASAEGSLNESYLSLFNRLFNLSPISQPDVFFNLVLDTIDKDLTERGTGTEIAQEWPDFANGAINTPHQFHQILNRYIELTGDKSILKIAWNDYIGYDGDKMDINAVSPNVLSLILPSLNPENIRSMTQYRTKAFVSKEEAIASAPELSSVFDTYFFVYRTGAPYTLLCDAKLQENFQLQHITFQYDLQDKKVKHVEYL